MSNLSDKDIELIMSYVDGNFDKSKEKYIKDLISNNKEAKQAFEDLNLSKKVYGDYVSNIKENSQKIISNNAKFLEERDTFLNFIFKKPIQYFVAYPLAAALIFTLGVQFNSLSFRGEINDNFRGEIVNTKSEESEKIKALEKKIEELEIEIEQLKKQLNKNN